MSGMDLEDLQAASGPIPSNFDPETAQNDEAIEQQFAVKCVEQMEAYWGIITKIQPSKLPRLTRHDDDIIKAFEEAFPEYKDDEKLKVLDENEMKSATGKRRWREFMMPFEKVVDDYNFGTLIRLNCEDEYTQENSMFGVRLQFYAIEIARNRRGLNDKVWQKAQQSSSS